MRKQGAGKFPALILYNKMMTVPGKNLFSQIGNQTVKNTCCKECTDTLGNKIRQNAEVMVENTFCLSKDAQTAGCGGCSGQKYTSHLCKSEQQVLIEKWKRRIISDTSCQNGEQ